MEEYKALTGRKYHPLQTVWTEEADWILLGMGSVADDAEPAASYLRNQGKRVGLVSVKLLHPFPEGGVIRALQGKKMRFSWGGFQIRFHQRIIISEPMDDTTFGMKHLLVSKLLG